MSPLLNQSIQGSDCPFDGFTCSLSEQMNPQTWPQSLEISNISIVIKNISHVSNLSSVCEIIPASSQPPTIRILIAPTESISPENKTLPIETPKTQNHDGPKNIQYNITNRFRFVYRQFHELLVHLVTSPSKLQAASSLLTFQTAKDWFFRLSLTGGTTYVAVNSFNDRIFDFLQKNWTVSPRFQDFIHTIIDGKLDSDLPTYFASLDTLWDLWEDSQRAKDLNSQLLAEPSLFTGIHVTSFLWGVLIAGIFLVVLVPIFLLSLYCLSTVICRCCGGKKRHIRKPYKRTLRARNTTLGVDPQAIWENAIIDPLPTPRKRVKTSDNRPIRLGQSSFSAQSSEDRKLPTADSNEDRVLPASPASSNSSGTTITSVRYRDILGKENPTGENYVSLAGCIETFDSDHSGISGTANKEPTDFIEQFPSPVLDSKLSDVWLIEAFKDIPV
ncbi:hypothetical protein TWF506_004944 [Arthrobotrys conoides]|uniref:Uncharacterized protein n=1 Tax=Arthrobotrys conoides TaxID=74498 RepID=A0AAN8NIG3_9PEZI